MTKLTVWTLSIILATAGVTLAQNNCGSAIQDEGLVTVVMSPVGTNAPVGPDYGCVTILSRPFFGYFIACDTTQIQPIYDSNSSQINSYFGMVIWGPFTDKNYACNNLTTANIFHCEDSIPVTGGWFNISTMINAMPGELYYYMLTTTDTLTTVALSPIHYINQYAAMGTNPYPCYTCNYEVSQLLRRDICLITFDSASQKTKLIWEKVPDSGIDGYIIHRAASGSPVWDSIAYVSETLSGEFIDYGSSPMQFAETYKVQPVDSCGNTNYMSIYVPATAGFLQTYPSGNNIVNLNWNNFGTLWSINYEPVQYIHRGPSPQTMQIIDTIPYSVINYTDISAPPGQQYYAVERRRLSGCNPLRLASNSTYLSAMTNNSVATVTGISFVAGKNYLEINPIPVGNTLNISVSPEMIGNKLSVVDAQGKTRLTFLISDTSQEIDVSGLAVGTYWIHVTGSVNTARKFMISR